MDIETKRNHHAEYMREYYHRPGKMLKVVAAGRARRERLKEWLKQHKSTLSCSCGESDPSCLDFHHLDRSKKATMRGGISQMIFQGWTVERLERELAKCRVCCANCHRLEHVEEPLNKGVSQRRDKPTDEQLFTMNRSRRHYWKHQAIEIERKNARMREILCWYRALKEAKGCSCGESRYQCLDFHHRDHHTKPTNSTGSSRSMSIARLIYRGWSKERMLVEVAKCDLLCANCHRKKHAEN